MITIYYQKLKFILSPFFDAQIQSRHRSLLSRIHFFPKQQHQFDVKGYSKIRFLIFQTSYHQLDAVWEKPGNEAALPRFRGVPLLIGEERG